MAINRPRNTVSLLLCLAALLLVLLTRGLEWFAVRAQDAAKPPEAKKEAVDEKSIRALITQLGDNSFAKRESAQKRLASIGTPALVLLQKAAKEATDAEVRTRAEQLVDSIQQQLFAVTLTIKGHTGWASRIAVAPDGKHFVSCGTDGVRLWDTGTGKEVLTYVADDNNYWSVANGMNLSRFLFSCQGFTKFWTRLFHERVFLEAPFEYTWLKAIGAQRIYDKGCEVRARFAIA